MEWIPDAELHPKKRIRPTVREANVAIYMLRVAELRLSPDILELLTVGDIYDMMVERMNDQEEYPLKGNAEDIKRIFGG